MLFALILLSAMATPGAESGSPNPAAGARAEAAAVAVGRPVTPDDVARQPAPGTVVPGEIAFTRGGKSVEFLLSEANSLERALWRLDLEGKGPAKVIARGPAGGDTDANVSPEEALRRERQRLRETGITHVERALAADLAVFSIRSDVYVQLEGKGELERLTSSKSAEIDPRPDDAGTKVAFVRDGDLYVIDLKSRKETKLTEGAAEGLTHGLAEFMAQEEMDRSTGYWWSPDGSKIAFQETDERHIPLYVIAHQGDDAFSTEAHRYPFPGRANAKVRLGVVSAEGGPVKWLAITDLDDDFYLARVQWRDDKTIVAQVLSRDQKTLRVVQLDVASNARTLLFEETSADWVNLSNDLKFVAGSGEIVRTSERTGYRHIELREPSGKLVATITSGDWPVDAIVALDSARREVWFQSGKDSPLEAHLYRVSLVGGEPLRVTKGRGTHKCVVSKDGNFYVDTYSSIERPPRTAVFDRDGRLIAEVHDAAKDERLAELSLRFPEPTEFRGRDGARLFGAYYAPRNLAPGLKAPLVVMLYGGPHVQYVSDSWALTADMTAQYLVDQGFAVWKMDNRGSARRGHVFEAPIFRDMGTIEVRDQVDGVRFVAASRLDADTSRVGVTGGSYGGYMTLRCLLLEPDVFRAGVAVAPVTDWDGYDTCYTERYMNMPKTNPEGYKKSSALPLAAGLVGRLLLVHGLLDENVHFRHSARLTNELVKADKPFELLALPGARHGARRPEDRRYVAARMSRFFRETLGSARHD